MAAFSNRTPALAGLFRYRAQQLSTGNTFYPRRSFSSYLVPISELDQALKRQSSSPASSESRIIPLCASWFMPHDRRTGIQTFRETRIPQARFFSLDKVIDRHSQYPHMLPKPKQFAAAMSGLGIRRDDTIIVYDSHELGIFSAPRVAWTLRVFGHPKVHLLNNFRLWVNAGLPTESGELYTVECASYPIPELDEAKVASFEDLKAVVGGRSQEGTHDVQILDARSDGRWTGAEPEPREGISSGHMPGSINLPFADVLDPATKAFFPTQKLKEIFQSKGIDPAKPIINTCGTGVTACVIEAALHEAGYGSSALRRVYDGSWTEWAQRVQSSESLIEKVETIQP